AMDGRVRECEVLMEDRPVVVALGLEQQGYGSVAFQLLHLVGVAKDIVIVRRAANVMSESHPLAHGGGQSSSQAPLNFADFLGPAADVGERPSIPSVGELADQPPPLAPAVGKAVPEHWLAVGA